MILTAFGICPPELFSRLGTMQFRTWIRSLWTFSPAQNPCTSCTAPQLLAVALRTITTISLWIIWIAWICLACHQVFWLCAVGLWWYCCETLTMSGACVMAPAFLRAFSMSWFWPVRALENGLLSHVFPCHQAKLCCPSNWSVDNSLCASRGRWRLIRRNGKHCAAPCLVIQLPFVVQFFDVWHDRDSDHQYLSITSRWAELINALSLNRYMILALHNLHWLLVCCLLKDFESALAARSRI